MQGGDVSQSAGARRRLRILFVVRPGTLLRFATLVPHLAERGHEVHVAFTEDPPPRAERFVEPLANAFPGVTHGLAPRRPDTDGWRQVAWLVRGLADLARYGDPRFAGAPVLRKRARKRLERGLRVKGFEPIARGVAARLARRLAAGNRPKLARRTVRIAARMEDAIPASRPITDFVRERAPDVVLTTSTVRLASAEVEFLKSARKLRIP